ncbi:MAG: 1-phosphofructokinase family hexose kinase [Chloroflexota bacterium]
MIYTVTLNPAIDREYRVPEISFDSVLRATETRSDPGGKGFNVSRMLSALGEHSTAIALAGGKSGEWLEQQLNESGISTKFIWVDEDTRTNTTIVTAETHIKVNEAGPQISQAGADQLFELVQSLVQPGDWWVLAGSLPPGLPKTAYAGLIRLIREDGGRVFLDTAGEPLRLSLSSGPDWIKPNEVEAADLTGKANPRDAIDWFHENGIGQVAISLGKDGVMFVENGEMQHFHPPEIIEQNPIGAGDAFVGGMVFGLANNHSVQDAVRLGIACGAMAASKPGTDFGSREEIDSLLKVTY